MLNSTKIKNILLNNNECTITYDTPVTVELNTSIAKRLQDNVLKAVFETGEYTLYWYAEATLNLTNGNVTCKNSTLARAKHIYNTHWTHFNCFGDNKRLIQQAFINNDYFTVFAMLETAAGMLNIYDSAVFNTLTSTLLNYKTIKCYKKDDKFYSYNDIKEMLNNANTD